MTATAAGKRPRLSLDEYERGVRAADRAVLAQAITLVESREPADGAVAQALLTRLLPTPTTSRRVGITGVPGVGKSTFVDAIDPTSTLSGGSILGDKTRMARLSVDARAFIRPSPSGLSPGGIARRTRETMLLCEAAGFDVVFVETVGVGQGETAVSEMVDFFLVLALPGAGDELQGIKKGVFELADAIAVNKADGDGEARARIALGDLKAALRYVPRKRASWAVKAVAISALTGTGLDELWAVVEEHRAVVEASGELTALRAGQQQAWMWSLITERLERAFRENPAVAGLLARVEGDVLAGKITATAGAEELMAAFRGSP
jgi:LAO/AO transport system kinase